MLLPEKLTLGRITNITSREQEMLVPEDLTLGGTNDINIVRPANRDWACQTERCHTLSNKSSLQ